VGRCGSWEGRLGVLGALTSSRGLTRLRLVRGLLGLVVVSTMVHEAVLLLVLACLRAEKRGA
jgi:hypothetical protein